jgi:hypothetical protein
MSPIGKFLLSRADSFCRLTGKDIDEAAFRFLSGGSFVTRYMMARGYAEKLELEIHNPIYSS